MAKQSKTRIARTQDDANKVPKDQPVTFELAEADKMPVEISTGGTPMNSEARLKPSAVIDGVVAPAPITETADLAQQLEDLKKAEQASRERAELEATNRRTAEAERQRLAAQVAEAQRGQVDSQLSEITTAITAVETQANAAKQAYADAMARQDFNSAADAQWVMSDAAARLRDLRAGKDEFEAHIRQRPSPEQIPAQQQQQEPSEDQVRAYIDNLQGVLPSEKEWLHKHPEALNQRNGNLLRLDMAYKDASLRGIPRGTPEYFRFFNDRLGYQTEEETMADDDANEPAPQTSGRVSAPPSRISTRPSQEQGNRVTLSPLQREAAKWSGVSEEDYARGLLRLREYKQDGFYSE